MKSFFINIPLPPLLFFFEKEAKKALKDNGFPKVLLLFRFISALSKV